MKTEPLKVHEFFHCDRSAFEGLEHYYRPVEAKAAPQLDWEGSWESGAGESANEKD